MSRADRGTRICSDVIRRRVINGIAVGLISDVVVAASSVQIVMVNVIGATMRIILEQVMMRISFKFMFYDKTIAAQSELRYRCQIPPL